VDVVTGGDATCLKLGDGSYRCRGENDGTALTTGKWPGLSAPGPWIATPNQVSSLRLSNGRSCGLDAQGALWCWGRTNLTLETQNEAEPAPVPLRKFGSKIQSFDANQSNTCVVRDDAVYCMGLSARPADVAAITGLPPGIRSVGVGTWFGCAATQTDVFCWGQQRWVEGPPLPNVRTALRFGTVPEGIAQIAVSAHAGCALSQGHRVYCWGFSYSGEWGTGVFSRCEKQSCPEYDFRSLHEVTALPTPVTQLSAGTATFCAVGSDHTVWCWGSNNDQLVSTRHEYDPKRIPVVDEPLPVQNVALGNDNAEVRLGGTHACVKKLDGRIVCWGRNRYHQIADSDCRLHSCPPTELSYECSPIASSSP
jgi:alpha-tubulin suppressor-like RCC1 family protein